MRKPSTNSLPTLTTIFRPSVSLPDNQLTRTLMTLMTVFTTPAIALMPTERLSSGMDTQAAATFAKRLINGESSLATAAEMLRTIPTAFATAPMADASAPRASFAIAPMTCMMAETTSPIAVAIDANPSLTGVTTLERASPIWETKASQVL